MLTKPTPQVTELVNFLKAELGIGQDTIVDVTFVTENVMTDLHMRYMGLPGPTDVLSFPATDVRGGPVDPKSLQDEPTLGDIVICPALIERNIRHDKSRRSIDACVIHGILHLLGHDHQDLKKKIVMRRAESSLVSRLAERWSVASSALPPCVACSQS